MKISSILTLALVTLGGVEAASAGQPTVCSLERRSAYCRGPYGHRHICGTRLVRVCRGGCAPNVESSNVKAVEDALVKLSLTDSFRNAEKFRAEIKMITSEEDSEVKFGTYLELIGLSAEPTNDELMQIIGARSADPVAVSALKTSMDLNSDQADKVVTTVTTALKGNLQ